MAALLDVSDFFTELNAKNSLVIHKLSDNSIILFSQMKKDLKMPSCLSFQIRFYYFGDDLYKLFRFYPDCFPLISPDYVEKSCSIMHKNIFLKGSNFEKFRCLVDLITMLNGMNCVKSISISPDKSFEATIYFDND